MIVKHTRGEYSLRISHKTLHLLEHPPVTVHGLKLETKAKRQKTIHRITATCDKTELETWLENNKFEVTSKKRRYKRIWKEGRMITITVHGNGLIELWVGCSDNPLTYTDMFRLKEYLSGYLSDIADFREVQVRQIGINKDFKELRLEGVSSVSLHVFMNAWSRIYYKETIGAVRVEQHWQGSIDFEDVIMLIAKVNAPEDIKKLKVKWDDVMFG